MTTLHVSPREYDHIRDVLDGCMDTDGRLNEWQALRVLKSYYDVRAFEATFVQVHPCVQADFRLGVTTRGEPGGWRRLGHALMLAAAYREQDALA